MNWYRIHALMLRNIKLTFRGIGPLIDFFYWPLFDIILWGFTSTWVQKPYENSVPIALIVLSGLALWQITYRTNLDISFNLLSELWSHNVVNLFSTPLKLSEWIVAVMFLGLCNASVAFTFALIAIWVLYGINILAAGWPLFLFLVPLLISGWAIGLFTASILIYMGMNAQKLVWVMGWFFVPFSGVFYPINILPNWAQVIAHSIPMSYIFSSLRIYLTQNILAYQSIITGYILSFGYLIVALCLFMFSYKRSKNKGLARLDAE